MDYKSGVTAYTVILVLLHELMLHHSRCYIWCYITQVFHLLPVGRASLGRVRAGSAGWMLHKKLPRNVHSHDKNIFSSNSSQTHIKPSLTAFRHLDSDYHCTIGHPTPESTFLELTLLPNQDPPSSLCCFIIDKFRQCYN